MKISPLDGQGDLLKIKQQKTKTALLIAIHPALKEGFDIVKEKKAYLTTNKDERYTPNGFCMRFKDWRQRASLSNGLLSPHRLRKTASKKLAEAGCTTHEIMAITSDKILSEIERYTRAADQEKLTKEARKTKFVKQKKESVKLLIKNT